VASAIMLLRGGMVSQEKTEITSGYIFAKVIAKPQLKHHQLLAKYGTVYLPN